MINSQSTSKHRLSLYCLLIFLLGGSGLTPAQTRSSAGPQPTTTWALVIGISTYPKLGGGQQLKFAERDAVTFAEALKKAGAAAESIRLLTNQRATLAAIKDALGNWLARVAPEDTVYIYFAGHGFVEKDFNEPYLLAADSDTTSPYSSALSLTEVSYVLSRRIKARRVLVIGDAVREDFFKSDEEKAGSVTFTKTFLHLSEWRAGISVMLANAEGEYSREGQRWDSHGVFTKYLIDAIILGADRNQDGLTNSDEAFDFVSTRVANDTSKRQNPTRSGATMAQIVLTKQGTIATSQQPPASHSALRQQSVSTPVTGKPEAQPQTSTRKEVASISNQQAPSVPSGAGQPANPAGAGNPSARDNAAISPRGGSGTPTPGTPPKTTPLSTPRPAPSTSANQPKEGVSVGADPLPKPPVPAKTPPVLPPVSATEGATRSGSTTPTGSLTVGSPGTAPTPLLFEFETALKDGRLIEPKGSSAWDIYQQLSRQDSGSAEAGRLRPRLAEAMVNKGKAILFGDQRGDNISDRVEEFRHAGQMFARARTLQPDAPDVMTLEKLSAAQALIALQFYDEAERALGQLPRSAVTENSLGIVFNGKLEYWKAERAFKNAIELDPAAAMPHYNLGMLLRQQKNEAALAEFEAAATLETRNYAVFLALGDEYFNRGNWQAAANAYRKAVALRSWDDTLHTKLGHALYSLGFRDEANKAYQRAKELRSRQ